MMHRLFLLFFSVLFCLTNSGSSAASWVHAAAAGCCLCGVACLKIVTTGNECLVERFGKFNRLLGPGWHIVGRPFETISFQATVREQVLDIPPQQCFTQDNAPLKADAVIFLKIHDSVKARYSVSDMINAIMNLCLTNLREQIGKLTLDQTFSSRDVINRALLQELNAVVHDWGVAITRVEIQNLEPAKDILQAMELQLAADRQKRAAILKSEGERKSQENEAEGKAYALITDARARKESIEELAKADAERQRLQAMGFQSAIETMSTAIGQTSGEEGPLNTDAAMQLLLMNRYMEAQEKLAASDNAKVLMFPTKESIPLTYAGLEHLLTK